MRNISPKALSFRLALLISAVVTIIGSLVNFYSYDFDLLFTFLLFISCLTISYGVVFWGISQFIDKKFRLIYKTIHNLKVGLKREPMTLDMSEDIFGKIREEVIEWDKNNRKEIERLTDQEEFRRDFLGNVSHELKTPIFSIQGYILTLLEGGLEDETINRSFLQKAEKSLNRMIEMVDDLDEIAKLESNRIELNIQTFNLMTLINEVLEAVEYKAKRKNIKLNISNESNSAMVKADAAKITQVITNLLMNSINYGKEGGKTSIRLYDLADNILVEVKDNGKGIAEEHVPRLFERFYRVDKGRSRSDGGSGLGLAIVKHILEAHHHTINVRSKLGSGSTFTFTLKKA
ncbi:MAG: two-component system phosphate regulon sensor histidine kinase PhoR [Vicingaceae bacterium]|jgi:two-component system phosphate regulon sensor histidine kinase PhoR